MTRISGSVQLEISARNLAHAIGQELLALGLADAVADRVLERLHQAAQQANGEPPADPGGYQVAPPRAGGSDIYERPGPGGQW